MPGWLLYWCSEWRRARKIVQVRSLSLESVDDIFQLVVSTDPVPIFSCLAKERDLGNWTLDQDSAADAGFHQLLTSGAGIGPDGSPKFFESTHTLFSSVSTKTLRSGKGKEYDTKHLLLARPPAPTPRKLSPVRPRSRWSAQRGHFAGSGEVNKAVIFHNPAHPLYGLFDVCSQADFVGEIRKRLVSDRLFNTECRETPGPALNSEEAEDLFATLLAIQKPSGCATDNLIMGKAMDRVVDKILSLRHLKEFIENDASSLPVFFDSLDLDKSKALEPVEIQHYLNNADTEVTSTLSKAFSVDGQNMDKLAESVFSVLDLNNDGLVEEWELKHQVSLAAPSRTFAVEVLGHLEMKHGIGNINISLKNLDVPTLYDRLCHEDGLELSVEDVVGLCRTFSGKAPKTNPYTYNHSFEGLEYLVPFELQWGLEPVAVDICYAALGARALMMERSRRSDFRLPLEALVENPVPDETTLKARFTQLWERCRGPVTQIPLASATTRSRTLEEICCMRYIETALSMKESRPSPSPCSLFPNVGDVLATPSTRLYSGRPCIVRYRLQGNGSFWHKSHEVRGSDRQSFQWPLSRKVLGDGPCVALVPRGISRKAGGGGGFYHGNRTITNVDPNMRVDLPKDPVTGTPNLHGCVELHVPSLKRGKCRSSNGFVAEFEIRLFCCLKQKIVGCIGEPLLVQVVHSEMPPRLESIQVCVDGRTALLRWSKLNFHSLAGDCSDFVTIRACLRVRGETEREAEFDADATEWEIDDLIPDTEYECRARLENKFGPGLDVVVSFRTNAICAAPTGLCCVGNSTACVDLRWQKLRSIGNETSKDRCQRENEYTRIYRGTLRVSDEKETSATDEFEETAANEVCALSRFCSWPATDVREDADGSKTVRISNLRPDTRYVLEKFCAVNSMGCGTAHPKLTFWTLAQAPKIAAIRVKHDLVLAALSLDGGFCVSEYTVEVQRVQNKTGKVLSWAGGTSSTNFNLPRSNLSGARNGNGFPLELSMPFEEFPIAESSGSHAFRLKAKNPGGWSDWSPIFECTAVARQQGADQAEVRLIEAIAAHRIDSLQQTLNDVRGIEFSDDRYVREATALLDELVEAETLLKDAITERNPIPLRCALERSRAVELPEIANAEKLLHELEEKLTLLTTAKGIECLRAAIDDGIQAALPESILVPFRQTLVQREAAEARLLDAMAEARVSGLVEALSESIGMHLPSEELASEMLVALQACETLLHAALETGSIYDLRSAMDSVESSGLKDDTLVISARTKLAELTRAQILARRALEKELQSRHPGRLAKRLEEAVKTQVPEEELAETVELLELLQRTMHDMAVASRVEQRRNAIEAARRAKIPEELLEVAAVQLDCLLEVEQCMLLGRMRPMHASLRRAVRVGLKDHERAPAKAKYHDWRRAKEEVEIAMALLLMQDLEDALEQAAHAGISECELVHPKHRLLELKHRRQAEDKLKTAIGNANLEELKASFKHANDMNVVSTELLREASSLIARLVTFREKIASASEVQELYHAHATLMEVAVPPALPNTELEPLETMFMDLRMKEHESLLSEIEDCEKEQDWRLMHALLDRVSRAASVGVEIPEFRLKELYETAGTWEKAANDKLEYELLIDRKNGRKTQPMSQDAAIASKISLPMGAVTGRIGITFQHAGELVYRFPAEIIEGQFFLEFDDERGAFNSDANEMPEGSARAAMCDKADKRVQEFIRVFEKMMHEDDRAFGERHRGNDDDFGRDIFDGLISVKMSFYILANHSAIDIAGALCAKRHIPERKSERRRRSSYIVNIEGVNVVSPTAQALAERMNCSQQQALPDGTTWAPVEYIQNVRVRRFREISFEISWLFARGIMETADCCFVLFDEERLVDIIDARGHGGSKYGGISGAVLTRGTNGQLDCINESVRHCGSETDHVTRSGKQTMKVRLDLLPDRIIDIFFVLVSSNTRDLSKFSNFKVSVSDSLTNTVMLDMDMCDPSNNEACVLCLLHRQIPGDRLWRLNKIGVPCSGTTREYRPLFFMLSQLGYPRHATLKNHVPMILSAIQQNLAADVVVKSTEIDTESTDVWSRLVAGFAVELHDGDARPRDILAKFENPAFEDGIAAAISNTMGKKYNKTSLEIFPVSLKALSKLSVAFQWEYCRVALAQTVDTETAKRRKSFQVNAKCMQTQGSLPGVPVSIAEATSSRSSLTSSTSKGHMPSPKGLNFKLKFLAQKAKTNRSTLKHTDTDSNYSGEDGNRRTSEDLVLDQMSDETAGSNFPSVFEVDGACVVFAGKRLMEVVDYRGAHGVRIVSNGVLDFAGTWLGCLGCSDATSGAVKHIGCEMEDHIGIGKRKFEVDLALVPKGVSELYFIMSFPFVNSGTGQTIGAKKVSIHDVASMQHHIAACEPLRGSRDEPSSVFCAIRRIGGDQWALHTYGCPCSGNSRDYRPIVDYLRRIQEAVHQNPTPWPHCGGPPALTPEVISTIDARQLPRLQPPVELPWSESEDDEESQDGTKSVAEERTCLGPPRESILIPSSVGRRPSNCLWSVLQKRAGPFARRLSVEQAAVVGNEFRRRSFGHIVSDLRRRSVSNEADAQPGSLRRRSFAATLGEAASHTRRRSFGSMMGSGYSSQRSSIETGSKRSSFEAGSKRNTLDSGVGTSSASGSEYQGVGAQGTGGLLFEDWVAGGT